VDGFWDMALGQEYRVVIIERQQATIEHPVDCATQGQTVSYRVWSRGSYRPNMRSLHFGPAAAVENLEPGNRAGIR
jgi:hypothetical protein